VLANIIVLATEAAETAHEVAAAVEKKGGLPQLNANDFAPQLFWLAVTFAVLFFLMKRLALPRISEVIEERQDRIQSDLSAAERLKGETEKALLAYEKALADARGNASSIARETREKVARQAEQEKSKVDSQIALKLAEAETRIAGMKAKALASVNEIAVDTAGAIVNKIIGEGVSPDEIRQALAEAAGE
jgi:F-type H+-transporting ATPase subunit b